MNPGGMKSGLGTRSLDRANHRSGHRGAPTRRPGFSRIGLLEDVPAFVRSSCRTHPNRIGKTRSGDTRPASLRALQKVSRGRDSRWSQRGYRRPRRRISGRAGPRCCPISAHKSSSRPPRICPAYLAPAQRAIRAAIRRATNAECSGEAQPRSTTARWRRVSPEMSIFGSSHRPGKTSER